VRSDLFDVLAVVYVVARVGQTTAHVSSGRSRAVLVRFTFFSTQLICLGIMLVLTAMS
jgi:hypothetical protein